MKTLASICIILGVLCVGSTWASENAPFALRLATNGDVALGRDDVALGFRIHKEGWTGTITGEPVLGGGASSPSEPDFAFLMKDDSGAVCVTGQVALVAQAARPEDSSHPSSAILSLRATALFPIRAECVAMEFTIPAKDMVGLAWRAGDAANGVFPEKYGEMHLWRGRADSFSYVDPATRKPVELRFPQPMSLLLQDSRLWGPNFSLRIELPLGKEVAFDCAISHPDGIAVERDEIVTIAAGPDWIPLENRKNIVAGSALDFSAMGWTDAPAGKHGWLKAVDGHFEFEGLPGVKQRFYGVNLCESANFPDHAMADELVTRLKRLGYNAIRLHHHDGAWANAHASRKVEKLKSRKVPQQSDSDLHLSTLQPFNLSTSSMSSSRRDDDIDRLDYLVAKCLEAGIYVTTDLYVSRKVAWRDIGFDRDGFVPNNVFKSLVALHEPAFENWASFARDFLLHENPYTGRRYVDEPGMPLLCLVNEGPMKWSWNGIKKLDCTKAKWRKWRETLKCSQPPNDTIVHKSSLSNNSDENVANVKVLPMPVSNVANAGQDWKLNLDTGNICTLATLSNSSAPSAALREILPADSALIDNFADSAAAQCFAAFVEREAFAREKAYLESLGCKALLTSQNCSDDQAMASLRETFDYVDNHCYLDHPKFLGKLWSGAFRLDPGGNPVKVESGPLANAAFTRIAGKPYTLTEWNLPGPGQYRGAGGLLMGAMAARQDWSGMWRFAYSHTERALSEGYGAPHLFDLAVDSVNLASERAVMCLFLRGDMAPLETKVALDVGAPHLTPDGKPAANRPEWMDEAWNIQVGRIAGERPLFTNENRHNCPQIAKINANVANVKVLPMPVSNDVNVGQNWKLNLEDTPDFTIDREAGSIIVATPRTCGVFAEGGAHEAGPLRVEFLATKNTKEHKAESSLFTNSQCSPIDNTNTNVANVEVLPMPVPNVANSGQDWKLDLDTGNIPTMATLSNSSVANVEVLPMPVSNVANAGQDWKLNLDTGNIPTLATLSNSSAPLRLCVENNPATVFATSLDGAPLETSSRILITHLTDAQAEGNVFADRARSILLKWGKGRTLVRNGAARVSLALDDPNTCEVWGLATDGTCMERVPATAENGRLSFTSDVDSGRGARMFYEIWRKP